MKKDIKSRYLKCTFETEKKWTRCRKKAKKGGGCCKKLWKKSSVIEKMGVGVIENHGKNPL